MSHADSLIEEHSENHHIVKGCEGVKGENDSLVYSSENSIFKGVSYCHQIHHIGKAIAQQRNDVVPLEILKHIVPVGLTVVDVSAVHPLVLDSLCPSVDDQNDVRDQADVADRTKALVWYCGDSEVSKALE